MSKIPDLPNRMSLLLKTTTGNTVELPVAGPYVIMANYKGRIKREIIVRQ